MLWLHRYLRLLTCASLLLITAGGLVTSTGSGLSVPDWPSSYGYFMYSFPLSSMVGGIFYEHGHRLIASTVGLMTIGLAVWVTRVDGRRWMRRLGWMALLAVCVQGLLGGLTVIYLLPTPISVSHAGLAPLFFVLVVSLAIFTSPGWLRGYDRNDAMRRSIDSDRLLGHLTRLAPLVIFGQILVGATMRHTGAGLAIPDFPWSFGRVVPPVWTAAVGVHYTHRVGALVVSGVVLALLCQILAHHRQKPELSRPAVLLATTVVVQVALGAWTVLSERHVNVNTAHVATGAVLFVTSVVLMLRVHHGRFSDTTRAGRAPAGGCNQDASVQHTAGAPRGAPGVMP